MKHEQLAVTDTHSLDYCNSTRASNHRWADTTGERVTWLACHPPTCTVH